MKFETLEQMLYRKPSLECVAEIEDDRAPIIAIKLLVAMTAT